MFFGAFGAFGVVFTGIQGVWNPKSLNQKLHGDGMTELQHPPLRSKCFRDLRGGHRHGVAADQRLGVVVHEVRGDQHLCSICSAALRRHQLTEVLSAS